MGFPGINTCVCWLDGIRWAYLSCATEWKHQLPNNIIHVNQYQQPLVHPRHMSIFHLLPIPDSRFMSMLAKSYQVQTNPTYTFINWFTCLATYSIKRLLITEPLSDIRNLSVANNVYHMKISIPGIEYMNYGSSQLFQNYREIN